MILDARFLHAARKINERLLFGIRRQLARGIFQRGQLEVGIEDVELRVVRRERSAVVAFIARCAAQAGKIRAFTDGHAAQRGNQALAIVRKINDGLEFGGERHDGDHVRRGHLRLQKFDGGFLRPRLFQRFHRTEIEKQSDESLVLIALRIASSLRRDRGARRYDRRSGHALFHRPRPGSERERSHRLRAQVLALEDGHLLRNAIFQYLKIRDQASRFVFHRDVDHNQLRIHGKRRLLCRKSNGGERQEQYASDSLCHSYP